MDSMNPALLIAPMTTRLNLGKHQLEDILLATLGHYQRDPLFCVPAPAREIVTKNDKETLFIVLGTKDFAATFISMITDKSRVLGVVDDFKCHRGEQFHGINIISTDSFLALTDKNADIIAINSCRFDHSRRFFDTLCQANAISCLNHEQAVRLLQLNDIVDHRMADWGPTILSRFAEYIALEKRLSDPYSIETLHSVLLFHLTCNPEWHLNISRPYSSLYFRSGLFSFSDKEKFVDCGASIGESTSGLIGVTQGQFVHSWMIEPDKFNIQTLQKFRRKYVGTSIAEKISLHSCAVGDSEFEAPFHHQGGHGGYIAPVTDEKYEMVKIRPIDNVIDDVPTFIKMDIEGFELPALRGSIKSIQAGKPKLAISAYHRPADLLDLTHFIDSIAPGYMLGLRHHTEDRWDTCLYFYE